MATCYCTELNECWNCYIKWLFRHPAFRTLLITNIDPRLEPEDLGDVFEAFGPLIGAEIKADQLGRSASGRVCYRSVVGAVVAAEDMNGFELVDSKLRVQYGGKCISYLLKLIDSKR